MSEPQDRLRARRGEWLVAAVPAALLWALIAYLGSIEVSDLLRGAETEHSPLFVMAYLLVPAGLLTWASVLLRRR